MPERMFTNAQLAELNGSARTMGPGHVADLVVGCGNERGPPERRCCLTRRVLNGTDARQRLPYAVPQESQVSVRVADARRTTRKGGAMTIGVFSRMVVAVGISTMALFGLGVPTSAQPPPQHDQKPQDDQKGKKEEKAEKQQDKQQQQAQKKQEHQQAKQQQAANKQQQRLTSQDQQVLIRQQQQRLVQYREHLDQQQRLAEQQSAQLQQQRRTAQYGYQQQYVARLREQQRHVESRDRYDYDRDPYFHTPPSYRYYRGGSYYVTNQYGVDLLRRGVNHGYEEGYRAGLADRKDHWAYGYEDSYAYRDANYGYRGFYVDRDDYNHYFREGFRRGYEDAYYRRSRYGTYSNGRGTIQGSALTVILAFEWIR